MSLRPVFVATVLLPLLSVAAPRAGEPENLYPHGHFDDSAGSGWLYCTEPPLWEEEVDESSCPGSGSVIRDNLCPFGGLVALARCVSGEIPSTLALRARMAPVTERPAQTGAVRIILFDGPNCTGGSPGALDGGFAALSGWTDVAHDFTVPTGVQSVQAVWATLFSGPTDGVATRFDALYVGDPSFIFEDGFEADAEGESVGCRWSSTAP